VLFLPGVVRKGLVMRITAKGQVTIPQEIRQTAGLMPGTEVEFVVDAGAVLLVKASHPSARKSRGEKLVASMRGKGDFKMSTDEVIELMRGPPAEV